MPVRCRRGNLCGAAGRLVRYGRFSAAGGCAHRRFFHGRPYFITPGISSCAEALYQKAAQLPKIEIKAPKSIIAKNTVNSFQAGLVLGHIGQTKYIIEQLKEKLNLPNMKVIATGGLARVIDPKAEIFDVLDPVLTLKGLRILYEKNK